MKKLVIICIISIISGCSTLYAHLTYDFNVTENDNRVHYETGAEKTASYVAENLPEFISDIENTEYIDFKNKKIINVYVFNNEDHYSAYSNASILSRGSSSTDALYLSPKIGGDDESIKKIMLHELSHIHIRQYIGTWRYLTDVPGWFHEGLAVSSSNGGGSEGVSRQDAINAMKNGSHFVPTETGSILGPKYAHDYGIKPRMYYKQASLFVEHLVKLNNSAFKQSYLGLINGEEFTVVWKRYYGKDIKKLWNQYLSAINA